MLRVCGELDFLTADQLRRRIEAETARHRHIVLDLTVATFYDRAALETLDEIRARARRAGCTLTINARRRTETPGHPDIIATADSPDSPGPPGPLASSSRRLLRGR